MDPEKKIQITKEQAVFLALQNDLALIRRGLEIHGMKKNGETIFISKSKNHQLLWQKSLHALKKMFP
tara:strand:- start:371 stop:571 length:201 start_codon:yes stop_codon:yes gene_type:complete